MRPGFVYVLRSIGLGWIKIGWAQDIARRMVEVAATTGTDLELLGAWRGTQRDETDAHRRFVHNRIAYDWYAPEVDILRFASALPPLIQISFVGSRSRRTPFFFARLAHGRRCARADLLDAARAAHAKSSAA